MESLKKIWNKYFKDLTIKNDIDSINSGEIFENENFPTYYLDLDGYIENNGDGWILYPKGSFHLYQNKNLSPHPFLPPVSNWSSHDINYNYVFSLPIIKKYNEFVLENIAFFSFKNRKEVKKFFLNFVLCIKKSLHLKELDIPEEMIYYILSNIRMVEMKEDLEKEYSFVHLECSDDDEVSN